MTNRVSIPFTLALSTLTIFLFNSCCPEKNDVLCNDNDPDPLICATQNPGDWYWIDRPDAICANGSSTGLGVRMASQSKKLVVFFQGGGGCFDEGSCGLKGVTKFDVGNFACGWIEGTGGSGIFNLSELNNPFLDWNMVFLPYCSGDIYTGQAEDVEIDGVNGKFDFLGRGRVEDAAAFLAANFSDMDTVLIAGSSAGGFGATINFPLLASAFPNSALSLIADSSPLFRDDDAMSPCMQQNWRDVWNMDATLPMGCTGCFETNGDGLHNFYPWLTMTYPNVNMGLISAEGDGTIRWFFGWGQDGCTSSQTVPIPTYTDGLIDLRDSVLVPTGQWSTYYISANNHVHLPNARFYSLSEDGVNLTDWAIGVVRGTVSQVGG